jgi:hypothetical protein
MGFSGLGPTLSIASHRPLFHCLRLYLTIQGRVSVSLGSSMKLSLHERVLQRLSTMLSFFKPWLASSKDSISPEDEKHGKKHCCAKKMH